MTPAQKICKSEIEYLIDGLRNLDESYTDSDLKANEMLIDDAVNIMNKLKERISE